jgi:hypothetical protein
MITEEHRVMDDEGYILIPGLLKRKIFKGVKYLLLLFPKFA